MKILILSQWFRSYWNLLNSQESKMNACTHSALTGSFSMLHHPLLELTLIHYTLIWSCVSCLQHLTFTFSTHSHYTSFACTPQTATTSFLSLQAAWTIDQWLPNEIMESAKHKCKHNDQLGRFCIKGWLMPSKLQRKDHGGDVDVR